MTRNHAWFVALLLGSAAWSLTLTILEHGAGVVSWSVPFLAGSVLGGSGPIWLGTGAVALLVERLTKSGEAALWTWTVLLVSAFGLLTLGANFARSMRSGT